MNCRETAELIPDYLQGALGTESTSDVEAHLRGCAECSEEVALWDELESIDAPFPRATSQQRFQAMLNGYDAARRTRRFAIAQIAAAAVVAIVAFAAGRQTLHGELADTRQLIVVSLLQQESASDRLNGVTWTRAITRPKPEVVDALVNALRYDDSVDVRMAALDALRRYDDRAAVRSALGQSLSAQTSPLVQMAVIDYCVESRDRSALETFAQRQDLIPVVREHVQRSLRGRT